MARSTSVVLGFLGSMAVAGGGGFALGTGLALIGGLRDEVYITETWSYVPGDQWVLHGALLGLTLMIVVAAFEFALLGAILLLRHRMLIGGVGAGLSLMGMLMLLLALRAAGLDDGQRWMFGLMGPALSAFGLAMVRADVNGPRRDRPPR